MDAKRPRVHVMIGLPGSGKSTWIRNYTRDLDAKPVIISTDALIDAHAAAKGVTYDEAFDEVNFKQLNQESKRRIHEAVANQQDIIIDMNNMSAKMRRGWTKHIPATYEKIAVLFVVPDDVREKRLAERHHATGKSVPAKVIENMAKKYDAPTREEFDKIITVRN